jgi:hypothetical protein
MPSGNVELLGTAISSGDYDGSNVKANAFDGNYSTQWTGNAANPWIGVDFGGPVSVSRFSASPRQNVYPDTGNYSAQVQAWEIKTGNSAPDASASNLTQVDVYSNHYNRILLQNQRNVISIGDSNGRYWVLKIDTTTSAGFGSCSELIFIGPYAAGIGGRPVLPVITPHGGLYPSDDGVVVEMSSETTSALLYYTTDGSTPTTSSILYTGPFRLRPTFAGTTIKVLASDAGLSTSSSRIATAIFYKKGLTPRHDWRDSSVGELIEAHGGGMYVDRINKRYHWFGFNMNAPNDGGDSEAGRGIRHYSGTELLNWIEEDQVCAGFPTFLNPAPDWHVQRPHAIGPNPTTGKYVLWCTAGSNYPAAQAQCFTADSLGGPWTLVTSALSPNGHGIKDNTIFYDEDTGKAYLVYTPTDNSGIWITELDTNWTNVTATEQKIVWPSREAQVMIKTADRFWLIASTFNFYNDLATYDVRYISVSASGVTPATAAWDASAPALLYTSDPLGTVHQNQSSHIFRALGPTEQWIYMGDFWNGPGLNPPGPKELFKSRQVWGRLEFPTSTTMRIVASSNNNWIPHPLPVHFRGPK